MYTYSLVTSTRYAKGITSKTVGTWGYRKPARPQYFPTCPPPPCMFHLLFHVILHCPGPMSMPSKPINPKPQTLRTTHEPLSRNYEASHHPLDPDDAFPKLARNPLYPLQRNYSRKSPCNLHLICFSFEGLQPAFENSAFCRALFSGAQSTLVWRQSENSSSICFFLRASCAAQPYC